MRFASLVCFLMMSLSSVAFCVTFEADDHCVAWKANKTMFLFNEVEAIGKNCELDLAFVEQQSGLFVLHLELPLSAFDSGEKERDEHVSELLGGTKNPNLILESEAKTRPDWDKFFAAESSELSVELKLGDKSFPLKLSPVVDSQMIVGSVEVDLEKDLELSSPSVAFGLVAKVDPVVELHFHLLQNKIKNVDELSQ